jgi:hypothetical protein
MHSPYPSQYLPIPIYPTFIYFFIEVGLTFKRLRYLMVQLEFGYKYIPMKLPVVNNTILYT